MTHPNPPAQASDEPMRALPHLPRAVGYLHTMDNTEGIKGNKPQIVFSRARSNPFGIPRLDYSASFPVTTETLFTADQMKEYARAALKAQPAPTEAQGDAVIPASAVQGEDSARLDWLIENVCSGSIGFSNGDFIGSQSFDELKEYIDTQLAVPQPQEQP